MYRSLVKEQSEKDKHLENFTYYCFECNDWLKEYCEIHPIKFYSSTPVPIGAHCRARSTTPSMLVG